MVPRSLGAHRRSDTRPHLCPTLDLPRPGASLPPCSTRLWAHGHRALLGRDVLRRRCWAAPRCEQLGAAGHRLLTDVAGQGVAALSPGWPCAVASRGPAPGTVPSLLGLRASHLRLPVSTLESPRPLLTPDCPSWLQASTGLTSQLRINSDPHLRRQAPTGPRRALLCRRPLRPVPVLLPSLGRGQLASSTPSAVSTAATVSRADPPLRSSA